MKKIIDNDKKTKFILFFTKRNINYPGYIQIEKKAFHELIRFYSSL